MSFTAFEHKIIDLALHSPELLPPCLTRKNNSCERSCYIYDPDCVVCTDAESIGLLIEEIENIHCLYGTLDRETERKAMPALISILKDNNAMHIDIIEKILERDFSGLALSRNQAIRLLSSNPKVFVTIEKNVYTLQNNISE